MSFLILMSIRIPRGDKCLPNRFLNFIMESVPVNPMDSAKTALLL